MLKRVLLGLVLLASIAWLAFVTLEILSDKNKYDPQVLFGHEDGEVLLINRPSEFQSGGGNIFNESVNSGLIAQMQASAYDQAYVSKNRGQLLVIRKTGWDPESIRTLFAGTTMAGTDEAMKIGKYQLRYQKTRLYLWNSDISHQKQIDQIKYDKKASATLLSFSNDQRLISYTDIYIGEGGIVDFITRNSDVKGGKQVDDAMIFAAYIPFDVSAYHFFEREYLSALDSTFEESPLFRWSNYGFVDLEYKGERVIVSDYIDGQDPVLVLQDISQSYDTNRFDIPLLNDYPKNGESYTVKYLEDLVVICRKASICDEFISTYKLGHTLALNEQMRKKIYGSLPSKVSEHYVNRDYQFSRTAYNGRILETRTNSKSVTTTAVTPSSTNLACNFPVIDFVVFPGRGNVVALGAGGEIAGFRNSKKSWGDKVEGNEIGSMQKIDLYGNGDDFVLLNTKNKIYLWKANGESVTGFPINLEKDAINEVKFYRWKGSSYFLVAAQGEVVHFDAKGRELNIISTTQDITRQIDVWVSQKRLFAGLRNDSHFMMYDLDKNKIYREFDLSSPTFSVKIPNELLQYSIVNEQLTRFDQKGIRTAFDLYPQGKIIKVISDYNNPMLIVQAGNEVTVHNIDGIAFSKIAIPFSEIADADIYINDSGKTYLVLVDAIENNVYLYGIDGNLINNRPLEGQNRVDIQVDQSGKLITTIVDEFVIQYYEN